MAAVPPYERPSKNGSGLMMNMSDVLMNVIQNSQDCGRFKVSKSAATTSSDDAVFRIVVDICIVGLLCLIGFIGNSLTFVILRGDRDKNSTTNWLLQTLAVVDIVYLVACVLIQPVKAIHDLCPDTGWRRGSAWSAFHVTYTHLEPYIWPLASIAQTVTVWVVVLVTVDRYIAICMPLRSKIRTLPRAHASVAVVIVAAILYNIPRFFEKTVIYEKTCGDRYEIKLTSTELRHRVSYFVVYKTICYFVFRAIGPLLLLIVLNARLIRALRQMRRRHRYLTRRNQQRENVTLTLVVVVSVFIACELPDVGLRIAVTLKELGSVELDRYAIRYRITSVNSVTNALLTLNSAANFFIYCLIGHKFRRILVRMCCAGRYASHHVGGAGIGGSRRQTGAGRGAVGREIEVAGETGVKDDENGLYGTPQPSMSTRMSIAMTTCNNQIVVVEETSPADSRFI